MTDITVPPLAWPPPSKAIGTITAAALLAAVFLFTVLISLNWSAVLSRARECEVQHGAFSSGFSASFDIDRKVCPSQSDAMPMGMP